MSDPRVQVIGYVADTEGAEWPVGYDYGAVTIGPLRIADAALPDLGSLVAEARNVARQCVREMAEEARQDAQDAEGGERS